MTEPAQDGGPSVPELSDGQARGAAEPSRRLSLVLVPVAAVYAWLAAGTTPFTTGADAVTAAGFAAVALLHAVRLRRRRHHAVPGLQQAQQADPDRTPAARLAGWVVAIVFVVAWELVTFFLNDRLRFPTASSLYDAAARWQLAKAMVFFAWLWLGWVLFAR